MRAYRARKKREAAETTIQEIEGIARQFLAVAGPESPPAVGFENEVIALRLAWEAVDRERTALQAEVKHLKAELALRPRGDEAKRQLERFGPYKTGGFNSRPFSPAPKTHR